MAETPSIKPQQWHQIYPYGTKEGDEEAKVFRLLCRNKKFDWRSTGALVKSSGLTRERVEEIIDKYANKISPPLIYPHPSNDDHWGYWERIPEVLEKDIRGISKKDKDNRIDKQLGNTDIIVNDHSSVRELDPHGKIFLITDKIDPELSVFVPMAAVISLSSLTPITASASDNVVYSVTYSLTSC
jgi:hypothetical protein